MELNLIAVSVHAVGTLLTAALLLALFSALALAEPLRLPRGPGRALVGLAIVRVMLLALAALFFRYGAVLYWAVYVAKVEPEYLSLAPVYDALGELGLAFGML